VKVWGKSVCAICVGKNIRNYIQYFLPLVFFSLCAFLLTVFVLCIRIVVILCVSVILCVYCCFILDAGLLARSQYPEGPATGHFDTGFSCFPCVYKRMLRWFTSFQVATTCFSCSSSDLNFLVTYFIWYDIFVNCNWVVTRWQKYSTHLHTNNT
jgi:hypothetical protein